MNKRFKKEILSFRSFLENSKNRKTVLLIAVITAALTLLAAVKELVSGPVYLTDEQGRITAVVNDEKAYSFPLRVEADIGGRNIEKEVTLTLEKDKDESKTGEKDDEQDEASLFEAELSELILRLSKEKGRKIVLPQALSGGTRLTWKKGQSRTWPLLLLTAPLLIWLLYIDGEKRKRDMARLKTESVERELPAFNDQLLLLLGSGLIFRDAFRRIAEGYRGKKKRSCFQEEIVKIEAETEEGVSDILNVLMRHSEAMEVAQFSRLAGVIRDNQLRGTDISVKLSTESEILWDLRKRNAEERGRLAETRLTLPLAMLLLVLVVITAAPAMIQVQGG